MFAASKTKQRGAAAATTDPYFPYVPLLLETTSTNGQQNNTFLDSSTNAFTITRNGTPTQGSVTPYWTAGQWSNYFSGATANSYLSAAGNASTAMGTGDFTWECWVYPIASTNYQDFIDTRSNPSSGTSDGFFWGLNNNTLTPIVYTTSVLLTSSINVALNGWTHVALTRSGTTLTIWVNGVSGGTATNSTNLSNQSFSIGSANTSSVQTNGYISNLRMVKGTAVYTAAFTPPTTPLTAITNTSLLTCQSNRFIDNSTNAFAITANGTPKVQAFQPFSPTASYTAAAYGGSGYFNGSTDYLTGASSAALAPGTGQYTLEMWIYFNSLASNPNEIFRTSNDGTAGRLVLYYASGSLQVVAAGGGGGTTASFTFVTGQWYHVSASRDASNNQRLFVNGILLATATSTNNYSQNGFNLGRGGSGTNYVNGYVSDCRLVNGTAVYTANFTPPTTPLTAITNTSLLLNCTNAGIYDAAVQNNAITVGDAQASTTVSKWSPTSTKFDGTGDWLTAIDGPQLQLNTGDFTIEGWVYLSATGVAYGIISKGAASTGWSVNVTSGNKLQFSYTASNLTGATSLSASTWYYFAVVRSGSATGNLKVYLNGTVDATSGGAVTDNFNQTDILYVGASRVGATPLNGYLQDVRVTKYARTITTPTAAFPTR